MTPGPVLRLHGADERIRKRLPQGSGAHPGFSWDSVRQALGVSPGGPLNIAQLALDRHADGPQGDGEALRWLGADGRSQRITYRRLRERCDRYAHVLSAAGLRRGDTLFLLLPRGPDMVAATLGALKAGLVAAPLHPQLGPEPLATRLKLGACRALLSTEALYRGSVVSLRAGLPWLEQVLLVGDDERGGPAGLPEGTVHLEPLLREASAPFPAEPTAPEHPALLHFTSGATGLPKGVLHAHEAALSLWMTAQQALDLQAGDVHWCTAEPGDPGGLGCGVIAPLLRGATVLIDEAGWDPAHACDVLQEQGVTVWTSTPTAIRRLMRAGPALLARHRFPGLRLVTSFGDALPAHAVWWGQEALGLPLHDQWWQTEAGAILIANTLAGDIKPGAMGRPLPGAQAFVVLRRPGAGLPVVEVVETPEAEGELAWRSGWPSMFRGVLGDEAGLRHRRSFAASAAGELYLTGDLVRRDADGYFWFIGHPQDLIRSAGQRVAPREVEAVLAAHPAVAEAAVIGRPDALLGEAVTAIVTLEPTVAASDALRTELLAHALHRLGPVAAPRSLEFASQLPHTRDGRLMRRLIRRIHSTPIPP